MTSSKSNFRIAFIGCVEFSEKALNTLLQMHDIEVCCVVSKSLSVFNSDHCNLIPLAKKHNIANLDFQSDVKLLEAFIKEHSPDVTYCFGWSHLLSDEIISLPRLGTIGFHPTELPKNRGRHPIIWSLALGLSQTATTFFKMDKGIDSGPILSQKIIDIGMEDDAYSLYMKITTNALEQIPTFTLELKNGEAHFNCQDHIQSNYWRKRSVKDGLIDWRMSATNIYNLIRALSKPYVGAEFLIENKVVKVWSSKVSTEACHAYCIPGSVLKVEGEKILIQCGDNSAIWLLNVKLPMSIKVGNFL